MDIYKDVPYLKESPYKRYLLRKDARFDFINNLPDILKINSHRFFTRHTAGQLC